MSGSKVRRVRFDGAIFTGFTKCDGAVFTELARFGEATFQGTAWFPKTSFGRAALFNEVIDTVHTLADARFTTRLELDHHVLPAG